jgi:thiol-disulfide isomerase/thioredoxin
MRPPALAWLFAVAGGAWAAPYCDAPPAVQSELRRAAGLWDKVPLRKERIEQTRAILEALVRAHPDDIQANRRYQNDAGISKAELEAHYRKRMLDRPGEALPIYFYALTLIGRNTAEAARLLHEALRLDPKLAWAHMSLAYIHVHGGERLADRNKAREHVDSFFHLCPSSYDAFVNHMLGSYASPELRLKSAADLRRRLEAETDANLLSAYESLWALEFGATPPAGHDALRKQVAADVARIRRLAPDPTLAHLRLIRDGLRQANDAAGRQAAEQDLLRLHPASNDAAQLTRTRWRQANPSPEPDASEENRLAHAKSLYAAAGEWVLRWPWFAIAKLERFLAARQLKQLPPAELQTAAEGLLGFLRDNDVLSGFKPFEHEAAEEYLARGVFVVQVPRLAAEGLEVVRRRAQRREENDTDTPEMRERAGAPLRAAAIWEVDLLAQAYARLKQPEHAAGLEARLATFEVIGDFEKGLHFRAASRVAELAGNKLDALVYLEKTLEAEPVASNDFAKRRHEELRAEMRRLWGELGGTEKTWALRLETRGKVQEAKSASGWEPPKKKLTPPWEAVDLTGKKWTSAQLAGKTVLVNLWATWCGPCVAEHPYLQKLYHRLKGRGDVVILTFNVDDEAGLVQPYINERKYTFPVLLAKDLVRSVLTEVSIPRNWLLDRGGEHRLEQIGFHQSADWEDRVEAEIRKLR